MSLKTCLLTILLLITVSAFAQDKIYKKDGGVIDAKVKTIVDNTITYNRADNLQGPEYTILKKNVSKIVYENGVTESFEVYYDRWKKRNNDKTDNTHKKYGDNILSVMPGVYTVDLDGTMSDPGIGICYERLLDKNGHISFTIPVVVSFLNGRDFRNYSYSYSSSNIYPSAQGYTSVMLTPGIKFYPAKSNKSVRYALGASFFTMFGKEPFSVYDNNSGSSADYHYAMYGLMVNNSVNISVTTHFYMSFEMNGGMPISDNRRADRNTFDFFISPVTQFLIKVGYRF